MGFVVDHLRRDQGEGTGGKGVRFAADDGGAAAAEVADQLAVGVAVGRDHGTGALPALPAGVQTKIFHLASSRRSRFPLS